MSAMGPVRWLHGHYLRKIDPRLPTRISSFLGRARVRLEKLVSRPLSAFLLWRIGVTPTRILGPRYRRSRDFIEIDITYACNLRCLNCNRSCTQAVSSEQMTVAQIRAFLDESAARGTSWRQIRIIGGEPTIHPNFPEIIALFASYRDRYWPKAEIEVSTNGHGDKVKERLGGLPKGISVRNTFKTGNEQPGFESFNIAPVDLPRYQRADYINGCWIMEVCGMGLTPYGYYHCAVGGAIDRVVGLNLGRATIPDVADDMADQVRQLCRLCGHFKVDPWQPLNGAAMSPTWQAAYERWHRSRPNPPRLYEDPAERLVTIQPASLKAPITRTATKMSR